MPSMPANITALKNQLSQPGAWVWLLTVTLPNSGPTFRFVSNPVDVTYDANTYTASNFAVGSFSVNTDGELPEFTMVVTNVGYFFQDYMRDYSGLVGGEVSFVQVNTDYLAEDWSEDLTTLTIIAAQTTWPDLTLTLGVDSSVRYRLPENRATPHTCPHKFRTNRCGYTGSSISAISFPSGAVVSVDMAAAHGFATGDEIELETTGVTGLDGVYTITVVDSDTFTLDATDGDDYTGPYTSGGLAGYAYCDRVPSDCDERGLFAANYGGPLALQRNSVRYA